MSKQPPPLRRSSIAAITPTSYMPPITPPPARAKAHRGRRDRHRPIIRSRIFMFPPHCNPLSNRPASPGIIGKQWIYFEASYLPFENLESKGQSLWHPGRQV